MNPQWVSDIGRNSSNVAYALGDEESRIGVGDENGANSVSVVEAEDEAVGEAVSNAINPRAASPNATVAMTITNSSGAIVEDGGELTTDATLGVVTYITSNIAVNVRDIKNFYVTVQAADGASQKLVGTRHSQEINGVGTNVKPANFPDNTWGSALTPVTSSTSNIDVTSLSYSTLPAYNTTPLQQSSVIGLADGTYNLKLVFAAKINADKPADSYGTTTMVSVVATPKELINYSIIYNGNGSTSGSVATQTASSTAASYTFTVAAQGNLARAGYTFAGWADTSTAATPQYTAGVSKLTLASAAPVKTLYAIWRKNYTLTYNANGGVGGPGTVTANNTGVAHSFTVPGTVPTRDKYEFLGWADSSTATVAQYKVGNTITLQPTSTAKTVYAVWKQVITPTTPLTDWNQLEYMQQMTTQACSSVSIGTSKVLKDSRDTSTSYTIKKLSDNKCWMTDNLRIVDKVITSDDSNVTSDFTIPASSRPWSSGVGVEGNMVHYANNTTHGAYYTWFTATAGTGTSSVQSGQASGSICPKGWRLPTGGSSGEFQALYKLGSAKVGSFSSDGNTTSGWWLGGTANTTGAAFFTASGFVDSKLNSVGYYGYYWSSTAHSSSSSNNGTYTLGFHSNSVNPTGSNVRYGGFSVRCVAK